MFEHLIISLNNCLVRCRRSRVPPQQVLLLLPRCLHKDSCPRNVTHSLDECRRCGGCSLGALAQLRDDFGLMACVVGGGREALAQTRRADIRVVVAVACEKELVHGIFAAFPKPVLAITNTTPEGPCRNTLADPAKVAAAVAAVVGHAGDAGKVRRPIK